MVGSGCCCCSGLIWWWVEVWGRYISHHDPEIANSSDGELFTFTCIYRDR